MSWQSAQCIPQRLVFHCRTTSASTAPCTSRRMCCTTRCASYCAPMNPALVNLPCGSHVLLQGHCTLRGSNLCAGLFGLISYVVGAEVGEKVSQSLEYACPSLYRRSRPPNLALQSHSKLGLCCDRVPMTDAPLKTASARPTPYTLTLYRGTSLMRNSALLGPYSSTLPWVIWWS